ncbi:hypothetical protein AB0D86_01270 [Streptomyces sp. NPDC048324]|uniref:hypothetical protein n=1 Tax=Streptomyces sp. NPDC048324 TaxID=3157205 RepID=UPI003432273E
MGWRTAAVAAVLCTSAVGTSMVGTSAFASEASSASPSSSYGFAPDARPIEGATQPAEARTLQFGGSYRSSLPRAATRYYRLELDADSNAYVSATAVPRTDDKLSLSDGLKVSVRTADGHSCSTQTARFGSSGSPQPITASGARTTSPRTPLCTEGGTYYVVVERVGTAASPAGDWDLELTAVTEPGLRQTGEATAPRSWDSATPTPLTGEARPLSGGAGFARAVFLGQGVWRTELSPGQTLFYRVPVDWGQQLSATAELDPTSGDARGYTADALDLTLYNPVRATVEDTDRGYDGTRRAAALAPVPPVDYRNRYTGIPRVKGMRFAGSYFLTVHLSAAVADDFGDGPFGLTLRVRIKGAAQDGPGYAGQSVPGNLFQVGPRERAAGGELGTGSGDNAMRALAVSGIGAGTVLLAVLGVWTLTARRRAAVQTRARAQNPTA